MTEDNAPVRRGPGRPRKEAREPQRAPQRRNRTATGRVAISDDPFFIDPAMIPAHVSYEWKRFTYAGMEDKRHQINISQNGWEPVPEDRHPGQIVEYGGLRLMERPAEMTDEAREEYADKAHEQKYGNFQRLQHEPTGHLPRQGRNFNQYKVREESPLMVAED